MPAPSTQRDWPKLLAASLRALTCLVAVLWFSVQAAEAQGVDSRLGFSHTAGELPGLDDGYTRFNSFLPLIGPSDYSLVFADLGLVLFNEQSKADGVNLGLGVRAYDSVTDRVYGGHFYYDYRDTGHSHYNQLSWGFESLGYLFDYRVNAYLPVGNTWNSYIDAASTTYIGSHLYFTDIPQEVALRGVDSEAVGLLLDQGVWQLRGGAGIYSLWHPNTGVAAIGPRARLELRVGDQLWLNGSVQHDDEFDTTAAVSISWRYGLTRHFERCRSSESVACRLGDPVERQDQIAIKHYIGGPSTAKAVTTTGGHAYTFHHVNSEAEPGGDGTFESPSNSLAAASNQPEDIVLVHGGSQFVGEHFVTTTAGQRVLAEGVSHTLETQAGTIVLPEVGSGVSPVITGGLGDAITIAADGVEVSGFYIDYSVSSSSLHPFHTLTDVYYPSAARIHFLVFGVYPGNGIVARSVNDLNINRNAVVGADSGIELEDVHGASIIESNTIQASGTYGVLVVEGFSGTIANNTMNDNTRFGLLIIGDVTGDIVNNQLLRNNLNIGGDGVRGGMVVGGNVDGNISGNVADESQCYGITISGNISGDFKDNRAEDIAAADPGEYFGLFDVGGGDGWLDGDGMVDDVVIYEANSVPWFAADLPGYNPNEHAVLSGIETQNFSGLLSNEERRVGIPMLVRGTVGGEISGNVGSVTAGVNLDPNVFVEYPAMVPHE
ncbi:right-handed parallel beta-helix repeat-containing protein [Aeoliella sp.]|uniref:right-handed parallel beta-helix repeat-containing protein n=1 Tax=Aeoliella sp. TaxID=2795800 RepID=UPI003CCC1C69